MYLYLVMALANIPMVDSGSGIEEWLGGAVTDSSRKHCPFSEVPILKNNKS